MVDDAVSSLIRRYLRGLAEVGIPAKSGIVFGSCARGQMHRWSDIDLVVLSPRFDRPFGLDEVEALWLVAGRTDSRIEPVPCGERQWLEDDASTIIEVARREGVRIALGSAEGGESAE